MCIILQPLNQSTVAQVQLVNINKCTSEWMSKLRWWFFAFLLCHPWLLSIIYLWKAHVEFWKKKKHDNYVLQCNWAHNTGSKCPPVSLAACPWLLMYMTCVSSPPAALALHNYANANIGTIGFYSSYIPSFQKEKKRLGG